MNNTINTWDFCEEEYIHVDNVTLPNGGVYTGTAIQKVGGMIEISGKGKSINPDGSIYDGAWKFGRPYGYGVYKHSDGDFLKGFFDDLPNGPGYLCLNTTRSMSLGFYRNGVLNGWAISIRPGINFNCSFLKNGMVVKDYTKEFQWMVDFLYDNVFTAYIGNKIQCSPQEGYIRFGAPNRTRKCKTITYERKPIGFQFSTDGNLYIGLFEDFSSLTGSYIKCTTDTRIISGKWKNGELIKEEPIKEIDAWTDIRFRTENIRNVISVNTNSDDDDDLPF